MSASTYVGTSKGARLPWGDVLLSAIAAVSWALIGMAGTAALGLHLLEADSASSLGPMTAAVVALGAGGSVTPSGDVSAFGLTGAEAATAIEIAPLGVSLVGAVLLSWFFLRSLRGAGVVIAPAELLARAGTVVALFVATLGGLAWAGHDVITIDGSSLGLDDLPGGGGGGGLEIPGVGDIGGLLPDQVGDLIDAKAAVGFTVDTAPTLLGGLAWSAGVLLIALLASRRTPLPRAWDAAHRVVRPAVSALVTVLLMAVVAGLAAAAYAAIGDDHPKRIAGAALLGAPNGVWLGIPIGLFVPFDGRASGVLVGLLPDPLDDLLNSDADQSVTLSRLADLDSRVWLLGVAAAVMMLLAGVLTAARTPVVSGAGVGAMAGSGGGVVTGAGAGSAGGSGDGSVRGAGDHGDVRDPGTLRFAGRCALRLGVVTALALPLLAWLAEVSVDASLSVLGFDAFGAGVELRGNLGMALVLGAVWGAGAGAVGALLARATGAAGQRAAPLALGAAGTADRGSDAGTAAEAPGAAGHAGRSGPYAPGAPYRPPNPDTNPYLRVPDEMREPEDARPPHADGVPDGSPPDRGDDMYGAPTVMRPFTPPPRSPRTPRRRENGSSSSGTGDGPPPPPPPPPAPPPRKPKGRP
ncbi:streptophobe family protein [Streptomyces chartreusis]|uniref:streptophobe family protein n=1 Tax=Streptomyces chartreusis TaxID=1969 RepID=UPI0036A4CB53